jgi:hypothetical protein
MFRGLDLHILTQIGRLWPRSFRFGDPLPAIHRSWFGAAIRREMTIFAQIASWQFLRPGSDQSGKLSAGNFRGRQLADAL